MSKRVEDRVKAHRLCAVAITEYIQDGGTDVHGDFSSQAKQTRVEKVMYSIVNMLSARANDIEGDDATEA